MIETHLLGIVKDLPTARTLNGKTACRFRVAVPGLLGRDELVLYCETFGKEAETLIKFLREKEGVYIMGNLEMRPYRNKEDQFLAPLMVRTTMVKFLGNIKPAATHIWVTARGNLGDKPDLDYTDKKLAVCDFDIGVHSKSADGKERKTSWVAVTTWNGQAEACHKYLDKGSAVIVRGSHIRSETWQTAKGEDRADLMLTAKHVEFLDHRRDSATSIPYDEDDMPWEI